MRSWLTFLSLILSLSVGANELTGRVVRVADGDTITVLDGSNTQHKVRLNRIDAPESGQAFGNVSKKHLSSMVAGKEVKVYWEKTDKYGRILGDITCCSTNVNLQMVKEGLAWHFKFYDKTPEYAEAEKAAREKKLGLWADPNPVEPYQFRKIKKEKKK